MAARSKAGAILLVCGAILLRSIAPAAAQGVLAIEQIDAETETLIDAQVLQQPSTDAPQIALVIGGSRLLVTGHVSGTDWYRVATEGRKVGYVSGDLLRPFDGQTAALIPPPESATVSPAEPKGSRPASPGEVFRDCDQCPRMVPLAPGSFVMGSNDLDITERPAHQVTIGYGLALGQYEVTVAEWTACVAAKGCSYQPKPVSTPEQRPVRNVSWEDARQYVKWLSDLTGEPYRLPSEAEWEYAARGGSQAIYWWGDQVRATDAYCQDCGGPWEKRTLAAIGSYAANPFGLYDMNGGVAEWTGDCWSRTYRNAPGDGSARDEPGCSQRVLRGGSWRDRAEFIRSTSRQPHDVNLPHIANGFRVARTLK